MPSSDRGARRKYPWPQWADGRVREFTRGRDFTVLPKSFAVIARHWANNHGYSMSERVQGDTVYLQFLKKKASR
jgi:hypothetical protein